MPYDFLKGHGTENDFILLPDPDGAVHGELAGERVRALCDRHAGIGGDGVLRVIRTAAYDALACSEGSRGTGTEWFMDYRNADGSTSEMCGNGIRVFARFLVDSGLATSPIPIGTRDGVKVLTVDGGQATAEMGTPQALGRTEVTVGERRLEALHVDLGNPHAVVMVASLGEAGPLLEPPTHDPAVYPDGVNVEFVAIRGERHIAMRVHERGSGETRSCGTGACAAVVGAALAGDARRPGDEVTYRVDVPGGTLSVTWTADDRLLLTGPALLVASGTTDL